jgi:hypothetical protein
VIRIRQTGISEAVEIFARLNSKGQPMTPDQMVSALMFRQAGTDGAIFDLATEIDDMLERLAERNFGEVDRTIILRAILANLGEDVYKTDWTRMAAKRRNELLSLLQEGVQRTSRSLLRATQWLFDHGVHTGRLLPYGLQLVLLSAFFDACESPTDAQQDLLRRWFWVSSFSGWFGGANPSRVNGLIDEFRRSFASASNPERFESFDVGRQALPYPASFDMRSARTRALLLALLSRLRKHDQRAYEHAWRSITESGPTAVRKVFWNVPSESVRDPANRLLLPPDAADGALRSWVVTKAEAEDFVELDAYGIDRASANAAVGGLAGEFVSRRRDALVALEREFQLAVGVTVSDNKRAEAPIDTD